MDVDFVVVVPWLLVWFPRGVCSLPVKVGFMVVTVFVVCVFVAPVF